MSGGLDLSPHAITIGLKLDRVDCAFCEGEVALVEEPRRIRPDETGLPVYKGINKLIVAWAMCLACRAKYTAWIDAREAVDGFPPCTPSGTTILDLSFRSTFSDEPGPLDMPEYSVKWVPELTPWPRCKKCGYPRADDIESSTKCSNRECKP